MNSEELKETLRKELEKAHKARGGSITLTKEEWRDIRRKANTHSFYNLKLRWKKFKEWRKFCHCGKIKQWLIFLGFIYDEHFDFFVVGKE